MAISSHGRGALETAINNPWLEVILARINPISTRMDTSTEDMLVYLKRLRDAGKGIIGMKVLAEGQMRDRKDEALKFISTARAVDAFTIGVEGIDEVKDNITRFERVQQG